jgi:hypothetical protein
MPSSDQPVQVYRELADLYERRGDAQLCDRFLVLAADAAQAAGKKEEAEQLRVRLLQHNPHHLLRPYTNFGEALKSPDVRNYVTALRRNHPYEKAEHLLTTMRQSPDEPPAEDDSPVYRLADAGEQPRLGQPGRRPMQTPSGAPRGNARGQDHSGSRSRPTPAGPVPRTPADSQTERPDVYSVQRDLASLPPVSSTREAEDRASRWVSVGLFWLVLIAAVLLAGYTLLHPFLPHAGMP